MDEVSFVRRLRAPSAKIITRQCESLARRTVAERLHGNEVDFARLG